MDLSRWAWRCCFCQKSRENHGRKEARRTEQTELGAAHCFYEDFDFWSFILSSIVHSFRPLNINVYLIPSME
jgi:hypothetical protein